MSTNEVEVGTGLVITSGRPSRMMLRLVAPVTEIIKAQEEIRTFIGEALEEGRDYGEIPGTNRDEGKKKRKVMLKSGAERTCAAFGLRPEFTIIAQEIDHAFDFTWTKAKKLWGKERGRPPIGEEIVTGGSVGLYRYVIRCDLVDGESGILMGQGVGSCSSMETKYCDRPRDLENTILKMAKKRAQVDAVLTTFGLSDQFTQDVEDRAVSVADDVTDAPPPATPEQVRAYRASIVELGATKGYMKWFDKETSQPKPIGWFEAALEDVRKKVADKRKADAEQREEAAPEPQPEVFERHEAAPPSEEDEPTPPEDLDDLPF